ncbi:MAG TPA: hypothetical protein VFS62_08530 [Chloroflexota bacterium]|nr:hypothetical protein [Chloroflexota bacterium]
MQLLAAVLEHGKVVIVEPVYDTIKLVEDGLVKDTLDRDKLRWPVAWGCRPELRPASDPPDATWFDGAFVLDRVQLPPEA